MSKRDRIRQAQIIIQAIWALPEPPLADDPDVEYLARGDEPLTARYARALEELDRIKNNLD